MDLLLIEDDDAIAESLMGPLTNAGFAVRRAANGADGIDHMSSGPSPDIVLLDLGLPDMDGYDVCRTLRATSSVPIIVVTARSDEFDRVLGLELGADDYMVKPLGARELVARIRAVLRRTRDGVAGASAVDEQDRLEVGPLVIDRRTHRVHLGGEEISFTPKEFELLVFLAEDAGAVRTRTDIVEHVWDANWFGPTKTVDAHVAGIRRKLGDPAWIESVRGVGFRLEMPSG
ncbi:MAG: response regulator transcription factor [Actinomycetota bacterium]|nr:response regulator transcription factor [Actinomycetota bacterium]MDA3015054.1 response regulator transcription factor [Actinomycetota bacterium]MDA3027163.1 response regulator transcription factor [Actinomycetota bacterium]